MNELLDTARRLAGDFLDTADTRRVFPATPFQDLVTSLGGRLPEIGEDPRAIIDRLASVAERGLVATPGPRYFGFVTGGSLPAAVAAEWLTVAWDQNAALNIMSPFSAAVEQVAAGWLLDVLGLPSTASVGFVTGATMANVTGLAAARHEVLRRVGWDVEAHGLQGAPRVTVVAGAEAHSSLRSAVRLVGLGASNIVAVAADDQGRMIADALRRLIEDVTGPVIVCAQSGNVNTGAFDPLEAIVDVTHAKGGWVHVDGAFGLWAAASPSLKHLVTGAAGADSWALDGHKWLNVPYDCGFAIVAHPAAHRAAMSQTAAYLLAAEGAERDGMDWTPEASRRARGNAVYAALCSLGRRGLAELIDRCCACARRLADGVRGEAGIEVLNDIVLNQVLLRFRSAPGGNITREVTAAIQQSGVLWAGGTTVRGELALRVSVSGWKTTEADVDRSVATILSAHRNCYNSHASLP